MLGSDYSWVMINRRSIDSLPHGLRCDVHVQVLFEQILTDCSIFGMGQNVANLLSTASIII